MSPNKTKILIFEQMSLLLLINKIRYKQFKENNNKKL